MASSSQEKDIFVRSILTDKVKIKPWDISSNVKEVIQWILENKFEGKCSYHGYIKPKSIKVHMYSLGKVIDMTLNGDVEYTVQYYADICNPAIGSIIPATVTNKNNFGILAEAFINVQGKKKESILEVIIVKSHHTEKSIDFESVQLNQRVNIEIMGKKFELNDRKISAWGKMVKSSKNTLLDHVELQDERRDEQIDGDDEKDSVVSDMNENNSEDEGDDFENEEKVLIKIPKVKDDKDEDVDEDDDDDLDDEDDLNDVENDDEGDDLDD